MKQFKAGLIGCGNIGARYDEKNTGGNIYTHAGMYRKTEGLELIAACDPDEVRLQEFGRCWGIDRLYKDVTQMLRKEQFDLVSIAAPDTTHEAIIRTILKTAQPRLILTEKPLADSLAAAEQLVEQCTERNIILLVDFVRRWDQNHQEIKEWISAGELGDIQGVNGSYVRGFRHNGCQLVNLIHFFFGPVQEVQALGSTDKGSIENDASLSLFMNTRNGVPIQVIGLDQKGYSFSIFEMDIFGTKGRIRLLDGGQSIEFSEVQPSSLFPNFSKLSPADKWGKSTYGSALMRAGIEIYELLAGARETGRNMAGGMLQDLKVMEAVMKSARSGNIVVQVS